MTQKEIEEAIKTIKTMKPCEQRFKAEQVLLDFAQSYLDLKEWPEENEIKEHFSRRIGEFISCKYCVPEDSKRRFLLEEFDEHIHEALHLCKLIYLKRENEIESKIKKAIESKLRFYVDCECPSIDDFMNAIHSELT